MVKSPCAMIGFCCTVEFFMHLAWLAVVDGAESQKAGVMEGCCTSSCGPWGGPFSFPCCWAGMLEISYSFRCARSQISATKYPPLISSYNMLFFARYTESLADSISSNDFVDWQSFSTERDGTETHCGSLIIPGYAKTLFKRLFNAQSKIRLS